MALNLSTLTSPATSGDVLAEALTTADFLEGVPVLRNLARGSQKGGDAKQDVALNQPKALPLDVNGKGYCYLPVTTGNAPAVTFPAIGSSDDFVLEMDVYLVSGTNLHFVSGANGDHRLAIYNGSFYIGGFSASLSSPLALGVSNIKIERTSGTITLKQNDAVIASRASSSALTFTHLSFNGQFGTSILPLNGYIQTATLSIGGTEQLNIGFTATNVRHGDTKFACATGQVVTVNQSGNDPATIIKKSVLRFDGVNDSLNGLFANNINGGYMFAAFSVLGDGGSSDARVFSVNATGSLDYNTNGFVYGLKYASNNELAAYGANAVLWSHNDMYDDDRGDILYEAKAKSGGLISKVNNANKFQPSTTLAISSNEFNVGNGSSSLARPAAIDLEFLALFSADSVPDEATATQIRNYINNRNNVFDLKDGFGYYFFDAQKAPVGAISSGSSSWNGRIIGSDNGDADKYATQSTSNDAPVGSGYVVTFADNTDHLDIPSTTQAGWQIVGTSLGTFAYRVDNDAVTELNLLGNLGSASYRFAGDLYGIILLPESATGADIEQARKLLIDRGAADGTSTSDYFAAWYFRNDIVEFKNVNMDTVTRPESAWQDATSLESFDIQLPSATNATASWLRCTSLSDFRTTDLKNCSNFLSTWQNCSALTSFPAGAKLGTSASNVNFTSAWQSSGLTSFSTPLPTATTLVNAFRGCNSLTSFDLDEIPLVTNCQLTWPSNPALTSFSTKLPKCEFLNAAWYNCSALTDFSADVFTDWDPQSISSGVFNNAWDGCTALTAQSVENILTSIDASGKYGTATGAAGGGSIDSGIDIDYDGTTLSAATNTAVTSLKAKGWSIIVNNVTL